MRQPRSVSGRASRTPAAWSGGVSRLVRRRELDVVEGQAAVALATAGPDLAAQPRGARTVGAAGHACARDDPQSGARDGLLVHDRLRVGEHSALRWVLQPAGVGDAAQRERDLADAELLGQQRIPPVGPRGR